MRKIGWVIGAVAAVVLGGYAWSLIGQEDHPRPGECASVTGQAAQARYEALDCGVERANVKVAKVVENEAACPRGGAPYAAYSASVTLCLMPNFVEGGCYRQDREAGVRKVDCTEADAVKVVKAAHGTAACGDDRTLTYPEPRVTFCLSRANPSR
ncbi:LppU/SCO3897 family protein [Saccharothrix obliqua]|uniref:LppU/SCO3897 family protein n=1 Tax=Saccharothrix obliqua TaxID=2861747 RepID=UPI001C5DF5DE|nr:hypothetical protein [Saccharothrix obliqua]MBW4718959.1 hypothetical protein [Saccharothrix obliqua]